MAKKKGGSQAAAAATAVAAAAAQNWIRCAGYQLDVRNSGQNFVYRLDVTADDGSPYQLSVMQLNDRTGLVQKLTHLLAERWPAFDFFFQADANGNITDVR